MSHADGLRSQPDREPCRSGRLRTSLAVDGGARGGSVVWSPRQRRNAIWAAPRPVCRTGWPAPSALRRRLERIRPDVQIFEGDLRRAWYEKDQAGALVAWLGRFSIRRRVLDGGCGAVGARVEWPPSRRAEAHASCRSRVESRPPARFPSGQRESCARTLCAAPRCAGQRRELRPGISTRPFDDHGVFHVVYDSDVGTPGEELRRLSVIRNTPPSVC